MIHFFLNRPNDSSFQAYLERQQSLFQKEVMLLFFSLNSILFHELQDMKDKEVGPVVRFYLPTRTVP